MIIGYIKGQELTLSYPTIASDTIDYLTAQFFFQTKAWDNLTKWAHFEQGEAVYSVKLVNGRIDKTQHLNLSAGEWKVWLHGQENVNGEVLTRITTEQKTLNVVESGAIDGQPFPSVEASEAEQILAQAEHAVSIAEQALEQTKKSTIPVVYDLPDDADAGDIVAYVKQGELTADDAGMVIILDFEWLNSITDNDEGSYQVEGFNARGMTDFRCSAWVDFGTVQVEIVKYTNRFGKYFNKSWNIMFDTFSQEISCVSYDSETGESNSKAELPATLKIGNNVTEINIEGNNDFAPDFLTREPVLMIFNDEWTAIANESKLYEQNGALIETVDVLDKTDGQKYFRLYFNWGKGTGNRYIDIPVKAVTEISEGSGGITTNGVELDFGIPEAVTDEQLATAIENYLAENPISGGGYSMAIEGETLTITANTGGTAPTVENETIIF